MVIVQHKYITAHAVKSIESEIAAQSIEQNEFKPLKRNPKPPPHNVVYM